MKIPRPDHRSKARIEIVPLIDIIFFLLATFVMVSLSMIKNNGIRVNLPVAATTERHEPEDHVTLTVTAAGAYFLDRRELGIDDLRMEMASLKAAVHDPKVIINGDADASFGKAVTLLDEVRKAGIAKVSIQTKSLPREK